MKKIIIPALLSIALLASLSAAPGYWARIVSDVEAAVVDTDKADIALLQVDHPVAKQVIKYVTPESYSRNVVEVDLGAIQPGSKYDWIEVLEVKNNNDFTVWVNVEGVSGIIGANNKNIVFEIWTGTEFLWKTDEVGRWLTGDPADQNATHYSSRPYPSVRLDPAQSALISFGITAGSTAGGSMQWTDSAGPEAWAVGGDYSGAITFSATRDCPWAP